MPPPKLPVPKAAAPTYGASFDPWNSSSTGHQRPENRPGTGWRQSRNRKLNSQFRGGSSGGERLSDTWGAGSEHYDEKHKVLIPQTVRERAQRSVKDMLFKPGTMKESLAASGGDEGNCSNIIETNERSPIQNQKQRQDHDQENISKPTSRGIFDGVVVYVNGSTFPLISDHKLKHILTENGGHMSLHLGRRQVTHIILGRPAGSHSAGAGGGLAGSKLEKEIRKVGGRGIKYVDAEWYAQSTPESSMHWLLDLSFSHGFTNTACQGY